MPRRLPILTDEDRYTLAEHPRPKTREDCLQGGSNEQRPCPWIGCRYHLVEIEEALKSDAWMNRAENNCVLDLIDKYGAMKLEEVAELIGEPMTSTDRIQKRAMRRMKAHHKELGR